jgi:glycosyltransferase involved in cell wall biosynthesis
MKIAIVTSVFPPEGTNGGNAAFFFELTRALIGEGHDVLVATFTSEETREELVSGVRVRRVHHRTADYVNFQDMPWSVGMAWNLPRAVALFRDLKPFIDEFAPDVIECVDNGFEGLFWALNGPYPLVLRSVCPQFHTLAMNLDSYTELDKELIIALEVLALRRADRVTTPSESIAGVISGATGIPAPDIRIIRNPLATEGDGSGEGEAKAATFGATRSVHEVSTFNLAYIGRIEMLKGCDVLIEALPAILQRIPNARLRLIGNPSPFPGREGTFADVLKERLKKLDLADKCEFLGSVLRAELPKLVRDSDICIFPSRYDSSPYACLEAMAIGMPIVASRIGGIPEYVEDGVSGLLFESENAEDLAEKVVALALDVDLRSKMRAAAALRVANLCAPSIVARQSIELYEDAVKSFKERARAGVLMNEPDPSIKHLMNAFDSWMKEPYLTELLNTRMSEAWDKGYQQGLKDAQQQLSLRARIISRLKRSFAVDL